MCVCGGRRVYTEHRHVSHKLCGFIPDGKTNSRHNISDLLIIELNFGRCKKKTSFKYTQVVPNLLIAL